MKKNDVNMDTSGDCVIPQKKRNASNDSSVELDKDGENSVTRIDNQICSGNILFIFGLTFVVEYRA